jgi:hypothetical protein
MYDGSRQLVTSYHRVHVPQLSFWDLWKINWSGDRFFFKYIGSHRPFSFCECFLSICFAYDVCIRPDQPALYHSSLLTWGLFSDASCDCSRSFSPIESMSLIYYRCRSWPQKTDCWRHYRKDRPFLLANMKAQKQCCPNLSIHIMKKSVFWQLP